MDKNYLIGVIADTKAKIDTRKEQIELFSGDLPTRHIYIITDESMMLSYTHTHKDGNTYVSAVSDIWKARRYTKEEAENVAQVYREIRENKILVVPMVRALEADMRSAENTLPVFEKFLESM